MEDVKCPYCKQPARLAKGSEVYPHIPKLADSWYFLCEDCYAYVGCHRGTKKALGTPANAELRAKRSKTHRLFDRLWKGKKVSRRRAYKNLANYLEIELDYCHIGMFDSDRCTKTIEYAKTQLARVNNGQV